MANRKFISTKAIIIGILNETKSTSLTIEQLQEVIQFIGKTEEYESLIEINLDDIEITLNQNRNIFELDISKDVIHLNKSVSLEILANQYTDSTISNIIRTFYKS